jgi:release factor glutamine methyltransferase
MKEIRNYIEDSLKGLFSAEEIRSLTKMILERCCSIPQQRLLFDKDIQISDTQKQDIEAIVTRLKNQEPIQYILGTACFYDLDFNVTPDVLIPRPETEELVERILSRHRQQGIRILDIGTGSGCIAVTLAAHLPEARVVAADVSPGALSTAAGNAAKNKVTVHFVETDILARKALEDIPGVFDVIVSNPPYVKLSEKESMEANVLNYEPHLALFVTDSDPLLFYRSIARFGNEKLRKGGSLYFEINAQYGNEVAGLLEEEGYTDIEIIKDIPGKDRIIQAKR